MFGKDVALLIVKEVRHQSTRVSLAQVSKTFYWAVRETIEYFLSNGGIASFGINNVMFRPSNSIIKYEKVELRINYAIASIKKMPDGIYYISDNVNRDVMNNVRLSIRYDRGGFSRYSTGTYGFNRWAIQFINNKHVIISAMGDFEITISVTLLPEK